MKKAKILGVFLIICCFSVIAFAEENSEKPAWWNGINFEIEQKENVSRQYFYILDTWLTPAYKAQGSEADTLFKKSIIALTKLIETFKEKTGASVTCMAQFQIAEAYMKINDKQSAKQAYQKCLEYKRYLNTPPKDRADSTILAVTNDCAEQLGKLK
ncbi:MAG: hypothetical protein V2A72_06670 [Candidatus Omnitrophota bacterium]